MSEALYEAVINSSIDAIITTDGEGVILTVNPAASRIFGYPAEELLGRNISVLTPEASRPLADGVGKNRDRLDHREVITLFQAGVGSRRGGEIFSLRAVVSDACQDGAPFFVAVIHDVSEETAAAKAQRDSELCLRAIIGTIPDGLIVIDEHGVIRSFSPAAVRIFGYEEAEIVGRNVGILMPQPDSENHDAYIARYVASGKPRIAGANRVVLGVRKNGEIFPHGISIGQLTMNGNRFFTGFVRDLTERQKTEKRFEHLQAELIHITRFSTMGQMASALAHELNQPLVALINYLQTVRRSLTAPDESSTQLKKMVEKALDHAFLAGQIVRRIRESVHKGKSERRAEKLNRMVEEGLALAIVGTEQHDVRIVVDFERHPTLVLIDKVEIQQVVLNLVRNAIEAMEHLGSCELLITTRAPRGSKAAVIKVVDTGLGIAPDVLERLFDPFVSTKENGLGLGLSICREIVEAHGGQFLVAPNLPRGTVFSFSLPVAPEPGRNEPE